MSRLATLVVALLLVTAGCTAAGPQSASSNDGDVTTEVSTATGQQAENESTAAVQTATTTETDSASTSTSVPEADARTESDEETETVVTADDSRSDADDDAPSASSDGSASADDADSSDSESDAETTADANEADAETDMNETETDTATAETTESAETEAADAAMDASTAGATSTEASSAVTASDGGDRTEWTVTVVEVIYGDTMLVEFEDGRRAEIQLVGVDAPDGDYEADDFLGMPAEDGGETWLNDRVETASDFTHRKVGGEEVTIRVDSQADRVGSRGQLLVYLEYDGQTLNRQLLEAGHAEVSEESFSKKAEYEREMERASQNYSGLWGFYESNSVDNPSTETPGSETANNETTDNETGADAENRTEWTVTVTNVVDGDTLDVRFPDGRTETVRLVGVDAPDGDYSEDDYLGMSGKDGGEAWLNEWERKSAEFVREEVGGDEVTIRLDSEADRRDAEGRLLVYVDDGDSSTLNADMIELGYAEVADHSFSKEDEFTWEEQNAYQGYDGLWRFYEPDPFAGLPGESAGEETDAETTERNETDTDV